MLKNIFKIFVFLFFLQVYSQKNYGKLVYTISYEKNTTNSDFKDSQDEFQSLFSGLKEFSKQYSFVVEFNNKSSHSYSNQRKEMDLESENKGLLFLRKNMLGVDNEYYYIGDKLYQPKTLYDEKYVIIDDAVSQKWILTNETKKIGDFFCYKAYKIITSKRTQNKFKHVVWYTLKFPLHFGPQNFVGLPGIVVEAKRGAFTYRLKEITLNPKGIIKEITIPKDLKKVTKEEFEKLNMQFRDRYLKMKN